ncbi:hypothetical protein M406DRAFT_287936 [Cryphonectria parasitica EP155]|uniref:Uncharacterized protein n=1 Tax=Cryphonectria parasitica (strain ATCC 38755 / EP155) TaxID=660469 RepID=A0A9P5CPY5_CRYP1|nr:uncharacterized protein M406DRAFT_287936 [Cryphonectria parasitica EP155]KAF3766969.1 hypothetical protein M406DRAFT_287936 [Cryphonectria parasitica EP155]
MASHTCDPSQWTGEMIHDVIPREGSWTAWKLQDTKVRRDTSAYNDFQISAIPSSPAVKFHAWDSRCSSGSRHRRPCTRNNTNNNGHRHHSSLSAGLSNPLLQLASTLYTNDSQRYYKSRFGLGSLCALWIKLDASAVIHSGCVFKAPINKDRRTIDGFFFFFFFFFFFDLWNTSTTSGSVTDGLSREVSGVKT